MKKAAGVYFSLEGNPKHVAEKISRELDAEIIPTPSLGRFAAFIKRHELPKVMIHSLRYTNITLLIMAGIPLRTVAKRAGHSSTVTTSLI